MFTYRACRLSISAVIGVVLVLVLLTMSQVQTPVAYAANGDLVHTTNFSNRCGSGTGVGIAFDGKFLWYSCVASTPDLYKAEALTGNVVASYNINGGLGALAWDGKRKKIWAGWGFGASPAGDVRLFDPTTGTATVQFNAAAAVRVGLDDGLAYDAQDDTLYISDDTSTTIYHYSTIGTLLGSFPWAGSGCYNSGLALGGELLFQGSNGCNHIWVVKKSDHSAVFNFGTGAGGVRDEDLECDTVTFSPKTVMWSMEAYEPRRAIAFEIPSGTCGTGGGVDSDGDGLLDEWETNGIWIDPGGGGAPQFIDLPGMGADPKKPDIFIQIDWMADTTHSHKLRSEAIRRVVDAFANSPYSSPTGSKGINLHVDQGPDSILNFSTGATWGTLSRAQSVTHVNILGTFSGNDYNWTEFDKIKKTNFTPTGRTPIFHYIISAHKIDAAGTSGVSRDIPASDFIVSLGGWAGDVGTILDQAGTLMHELGHNLGLAHGGPIDLCSPDGQCNVNHKPNYLSVMNYSFQNDGVIKDGIGGTFDYSRSAQSPLLESNLKETTGLGPSATGYGTRHFCSYFFGFTNVWAPVTNAEQSIDWNCDEKINDNTVTYDINGEGGSGQTLKGYEDWSHLKLKGGAIGLAGVSPVLPAQSVVNELTVAEAQRILPVALIVATDIKPQSCPNPLNINDNGVLSVAILGTSTFDATKVDPTSVKLEGVPPLRTALEDVASPFIPFVGRKQATDCTTAGPDGFTDLTLKFDARAVSAALGTVTDGQVRVLSMTGKLKSQFGAMLILGEDVVIILKK